jgi:hypothetical protein
MLRAHASFAAVWSAESAFMVALAVVAFREGGLAAVGVVTGARMAAAAVLTPFLATVADRVRRERVITAIGLSRAALLALAAVVTATGGSVTVTYAAAVLATAAFSLFRPAHSALLPALARSPSDLTAACWTRCRRSADPSSRAPCSPWPGPRPSSRSAPRSPCSAAWSSCPCRTTRRRARRRPPQRAGPGVPWSPASSPSAGTAAWCWSRCSASRRPSPAAA